MKKFNSHNNPSTVLSHFTDKLVDWEKRNEKENFDFIFEHLSNWNWVCEKLPEFSDEEKKTAAENLVKFYQDLQTHLEYIRRYNEELERKEEQERIESESYVSVDIDLCTL